MYFEQQTQLFKELYQSYPDNIGFKKVLAASYSKLGETHSSLGDLSKALGYFEQFNRLMAELCEKYHDNVGFKNVLAVSYYKLAEIAQKQDDRETARRYFRQAEALWQELVRSAPLVAQYKQFLADVQADLAAL